MLFVLDHKIFEEYRPFGLVITNLGLRMKIFAEQFCKSMIHLCINHVGVNNRLFVTYIFLYSASQKKGNP